MICNFSKLSYNIWLQEKHQRSHSVKEKYWVGWRQIHLFPCEERWGYKVVSQIAHGGFVAYHFKLMQDLEDQIQFSFLLKDLSSYLSNLIFKL